MKILVGAVVLFKNAALRHKEKTMKKTGQK